MAHSRLERIGTIYSRVTGLIRSGAMKTEDRPLWYEVYQAFPPKYPPRYDRPSPETLIRQIFYTEDVIRVKFYKKLKNAVPAVNLADNHNDTLSQKCIKRCMDLQKQKRLSVDEVFEIGMNSILEEMDAKRLSVSVDSSPGEKKNEAPPLKVDIRTIMDTDK